VASGRSRASAISLVVRPPTARSVSGIAALGASESWQHRKRSAKESSSDSSGSHGRAAQEATSTSRRRRAESRWCCSISRRCATRTTHPTGRSGTPLIGQEPRATRMASWTASSASAKRSPRRNKEPSASGAASRSSRSISDVAPRSGTPAYESSGAPSTCRTSMGWRIGSPPMPGAADARAAISIARSHEATSMSR
jgi:hypothetical protein